MIEPYTLARGPFVSEQIVVTVDAKSNQVISYEMAQHIEHAWERLLSEAEKEGRRIWNGTTQRVNAVRVNGVGVLELRLAPHEYKRGASALSFPGYYELPDTCWGKGAHTGALVETRDGWYVMVRLSGTSHNKNKEDLVGGVLGDGVFARSGEQLFANMYKELEEETATPKDRVERCVLELVYLGKYTYVGFHFSILLKDTRSVAERRFRENGIDEDVQDLVFVEKKKIQQKLQEMGGNKVFLARELFEGG